MTATNPAADVRQMIEDVKARHVEDPKPWYTEIDGKPVYRTSCVYCLGTWPCDAYTAATRLEQAVTALEWYADTDNFDRATEYDDVWRGSVIVNDVTEDEGERARTALRRMAGGDGDEIQ